MYLYSSSLLLLRRIIKTSIRSSIISPLKDFTYSETDLSEFQPLLENSETKEDVIKILNEYNVGKLHCKRVPSKLNLESLQELLLLETKTQRSIYFRYLFRVEKQKINCKIKKQIKQKERLLRLTSEPETSNHIQYGVGKTSMLIRVRRSSINKWRNLRLANATLFGQNIVLDLNYEDFMIRKEIKNCAQQLIYTFGENFINKNPYNIYLCNAKSSGHLVDCLKNHHSFNNLETFINYSELSYLNLFPKEKLVYLSPHAEKKLTHYDHKAVYIIGAFVDISKPDKLSHKKAESEGIQSYALPLEEHILWGSGSKCLSINQVFQIMLEMKNVNDWKKALDIVPIRKRQKINIEEIDVNDLPDKLYAPDTRNRI